MPVDPALRAIETFKHHRIYDWHMPLPACKEIDIPIKIAKSLTLYIITLTTQCSVHFSLKIEKGLHYTHSYKEEQNFISKTI